MADKSHDILKNLKDYEVNPPKNYFVRIWALLQNRENVCPPEEDVETSFFTDENTQSEYNEKEIEIFKSLQVYGITPPDFETLKPGINGLIKNPPEANTKGKVVWYRYFGSATAAVLIIVTGIWVLFTYHFKAITEGKIASMTLNDQKVNLLTAGTNIIDSSNKIEKNSSVKEHLNSHTRNSYYYAKMQEHHNKQSGYGFVANGVKLVDNDVLLTLASYKYVDYAPLLAEIAKNKQIQLDHFSYLNISDKMSEILKKMYSTKKNNKPTRRARKIRAKLEKWKKADEEYFDRNTNNNPLDIIDLSEFILK
jgi:hypothetical protein